MHLKRCNTCGEYKEVIEFGKNSSLRSGLQNDCKVCYNKKSKENCQKNKTKAKLKVSTKKCSKCGEVKKSVEFHKCSKNKDGLYSSCKKCTSDYKKKYNSKDKNISDIVKNKELELKFIDGEVYANANSMTDSTTLDHWKRSSNTERYINALNSAKSAEFIKTTEGRNGGTWIHEKLILSLARYISVEFEIWCDTKIAEFISGNVPKPMLPQSYKDALIELVSKVEENEKLQLENKVLQPKAEFYDCVAESKDTIDIGQLAKTLNIGLGRNKLFEFLRKNDVLDKRNVPYQRHINKGYFRTIESTYSTGKEIKIHIKAMVFQKGVEYIINLLENNGYKRG